MSLGLLLVIILIIVLCGGGFGVYSGASWGGPGIGIGGILLIILIILLVTGRL